MRLHSCALTLVMILGLTVPCYGNDLNDCWEAARVATSGIAAAEHDHQLRLRASDDGGTRWDRLAEYLISQLELIGIEERRRDNLADVAAEHFPGLAQSTWHPLKAVLSDVLSGEELIRLETSPGCVAHPSSVAKLEADLVDVGVGDGPDSYLGKDVSGKLVLASGNLAEIYREAVLDRGALGVISYFEDELDRGILDPEQLPRQTFADGNTGSIRPGTFAMTVMQGT
ncbi:MAG: hypothetical protein GY906_29485, partial [bacterium]|nr:hypothetical protein [bacterium]